jgi:sec-independent protein translocase protein TatA
MYPMFGLSGAHLIVLAIILLILGPKKLPELGRVLGKSMRNFKDAIDGIQEAQFKNLHASQDHEPEQKHDSEPDPEPGPHSESTPDTKTKSDTSLDKELEDDVEKSDRNHTA